MSRSSASALISARTSRPPRPGRFRSRSTRPGCRSFVAWRARSSFMAASPSPQTTRSFASRPCRNASWVRRPSPGLSSTRRIWTESPLLIPAAPCPIRKGEPESAATPNRRIDPYSPLVALDDSLADCQADAAARIFLPRVQTTEYHEYLLSVLGRNADPVVAYEQSPLSVATLGAKLDPRRFLAMELHRVADEVLVELAHLKAIGSDGR